MKAVAAERAAVFAEFEAKKSADPDASLTAAITGSNNSPQNKVSAKDSKDTTATQAKTHAAYDARNARPGLAARWGAEEMERVGQLTAK